MDELARDRFEQGKVRNASHGIEPGVGRDHVRIEVTHRNLQTVPPAAGSRSLGFVRSVRGPPEGHKLSMERDSVNENLWCCRWYMICPVEIARDMSAFRAVRIRDHAKHGFLFEGRDGAGDESTGSDIAGNGEEDHVVASGGNYWHQ